MQRKQWEQELQNTYTSAATTGATIGVDWGSTSGDGTWIMRTTGGGYGPLPNVADDILQSAAKPAAPETPLEWLDRRVQEVRDEAFAGAGA
jgi:hypothetical protein